MSEESPIHVTRWGTDGPSVLMIHGGPQGGSAGGAATFAHQQPLAERGWQLVLPDRPGHGESPTRGPEDMDVDAVWVAEMLGDGAHLLGHSYGGLIALSAAAQRPEAVKSLTLIETPVFAAAPDDPAVLAFIEQLHEQLEKDGPPAGVLLGFAQVVNIPLAEMGPPPPLEQIEAMGQALTVMRQPDKWDGGPALSVMREHGIPVLAVTGGWSPSFEAIAAGTAKATGGEHLVVETGHHFPQFGQPEFNDGFEKFLTASEARSGAKV